jgi:hypothetical protein
VCFDFLYNFFSEIFLIIRRIKRNININVHLSSCKVPVIIVRFQSNLNFLNRLSKNKQISNFVEIRPAKKSYYVRTDRHIDEQTDRHDAVNSYFSQIYEGA